MSRGRGGYIGFNRVPAAAGANSAASGVWTLREAEELKRAGTWPRVFEDPTSVSGLQLWLDASDASTLYDATTGGSLVAADGTVKRWEDKSGNNRHATQSTDANRPVRKTAVQNGLDVLRFDGSNDFLSIPPLSGLPNAYTFFGVAKRNSSAANFCFAGVQAATGESYFPAFARIRSEALTYALGANGGNNNPNHTEYDITNTPLTSTNAFCCVQLSSPPQTGMRVNGSPLTITAIVSTAAQGSNFTAIGMSGGQGGDRRFANADFCEVLYYNSVLSVASIEAVENYLLAKWGIT
jgi:hypothetical protein